MQSIVGRTLLAAVIVLAGALIPGAAVAAVINVSTSQDVSGLGAGCSLRQAIVSAQTDSSAGDCLAGSGYDTLLLPKGDYVTASGNGAFVVDGSDHLTIRPTEPGARVNISGADKNRVIEHVGSGQLSLFDLSVSNGLAESTEFNSGYGGGILSYGPLDLSGVSVINNSAGTGGGGVYVEDGLEMVNSTVAGNSTPGSGGGLVIFGSRPFSARSSTIARNTAGNRGAGFRVEPVDAHAADSATVTFINVLLADNVLSETECYVDEWFKPRFFLTTQTTGPKTRCSPAEGEPESGIIRVANAGLGEIDLSQGTPVIPLEPGSPAIRAGAKGGQFACPPEDQLGNPRPEGQCDIGATQYVGPYPFANLHISTPKRVVSMTPRHRTKVVKLKLAFRGSGFADRASICLRRGRWTKALRVTGKLCRAIETLNADSPTIVRFKVKMKSGVKSGTQKIRGVAKAPGFKLARTAIRVRMRSR